MAVNRNVNVTNINLVTALTPLTNVNRTVVKLQPVSPEQRVMAQRSVQRLHEVSRERARLETQIVASRSVPVKAADQPRVVKINLATPVTPARTNEQRQAPPPPIVISRPQLPVETTKPTLTPSRPENRLPKALPKGDGKLELKPLPKADLKPLSGPPKPESGNRPKGEEKSSAPPHPQTKTQGDTKKPTEAKSESKPQPRAEAEPPN
jgi:hypothetical protein